MWILLLQILLAFVPPICNSQQQTSIYHHATDMAHAQSYFNATSSFISRNADALAAEARHRQFTPAELDKLFRSAGCSDEEILLVCQNVNDTIIIENANFYSLPATALNCSNGPLGPLRSGSSTTGTDPLRSQFFPRLLGLPRMSRDLRQALNRRCSGLSRGQECSFNLALDHEESVHWGPGLVDIFFRCAAKDLGHRDCDNDEEVKIRTGTSGESQFLMSPMYPKYYMGGRRCKWSLRTLPGQRIQLRFLDISLKKRISSSDPECTDSISVSERGKTLMRMCGESSEDIVLLSEGNTLEVKLDTRTKSILPRRGILAEFWPLGCATQPQPQAGYLQLRNDTHAVYVCSIGHVFLPDLARSRTVECKRHQWNQKVGDCYSYDFLRKYGNASIVNLLNSLLGPVQPAYNNLHTNTNTRDEDGSLQQHMSHPTWFSDVVVPVIVVIIVVILSLFAMIVLLLLRRHLQYEAEGHTIDEDRSALTPASLRRPSPVLQLEITGQGFPEQLFHQQRREELFVC